MISLRDVVTGFGNRDPLAEVWRRSLRGGGGGAAEITGVPPLRYIGNGRPLTDYLISGNALQDGTPSAEDPVDVVGCGVRTGNLFDYTEYVGTYMANAGLWEYTGTTGTVFRIPCTENTLYTLSLNKTFSLSVYRIATVDTDAVPTLNNPITVTDIVRRTSAINLYSFTTPAGAKYILFQVNASIAGEVANATMLNLGSTALPYEPYGVKLPLTVNTTEYPIYLGQVETTRRVKKLVLTGEETWKKSITYIGSGFAYLSGVAPDAMPYSPIACTHASTGTGTYRYGMGRIDDNSLSLWLFDTNITIANFKSCLAAQYANGTPVTVWYVLAEPETAIVNEPLMKIGDYADTISFAQAGVTIPTVNGANVLDVPTKIKPSEITIKGGISSV